MADQARQVRRAAAALTLALAACAPLSPPPAANASAYRMPDASTAWYRQAAATGAVVLRVDPGRSLIVATVRRGGPLARLGHDHVVASHAIGGAMAPAAGRADFGFRLDQLVVDEAPLRAQAGLDTVPSADAIAGTRHNMLTRVLDAERYPEVTLQVKVPTRPSALNPAQNPARTEAALSVTLHGVTRMLTAPLLLEQTADGLVASGSFTLRQSDFGITPLAVMNGAMTVQDTLELRYRIVGMPQ